MLQDEPGDPMCRLLFDDLPSLFFDHVTEVHSRGTYRLTGAAVKAAEHMLHERISNLRTTFVVRPHEVDSTAR